MTGDAQAVEPPTNRPETGDHEAGTGRFTKGNAANRAGRPKGLARRVREEVGDDGEALITVMLQHATGYRLMIEPAPVGRDETDKQREKRYADGTWEKVTVSDQQAAIRWLADRGFGKPPEFVPIEDDDPLGLSDDEDRTIAESLRATVVELAERRRARESRTES